MNEIAKRPLLQASVILLHMSLIHNQLYAGDDLGEHVIMINCLLFFVVVVVIFTYFLASLSNNGKPITTTLGEVT